MTIFVLVLLMLVVDVDAQQLQFMNPCPLFSLQRTTLFASGRSSCVGLSPGFYALLVRGLDFFELYCFRNQSYLAVKPETNFGEISGAKTSFCAIRIDLETLLVDVQDLTFSNTTFDAEKRVGADLNWAVATTAPFGFAAACRSDDYLATAKIDLTGTAFALSTAVQFASFGALISGNHTISQARQVVDILGGGFCGWTRPVTPRGTFFQNDLLPCAQFG
jgi:hypothetical protein